MAVARRKPASHDRALMYTCRKLDNENGSLATNILETRSGKFYKKNTKLLNSKTSPAKQQYASTIPKEVVTRIVRPLFLLTSETMHSPR